MAEQLTMTIAQEWRDFLKVLHKRIWMLLTFLAVTMLIVVAGTWPQQPLYRATATILVDAETPDVLAVSTRRDDSTVNQAHYLTYSDYYRTQLEIMKSYTIAEQVLDNLKLKDQEPYASAKDPVLTLLDQVTIESIKATRLAKIHVEDPDAKQSARIANELALVFTEANLAKEVAAESMTLMKNEYLVLKSREAELSKRYKDKHPTLIRIRQEMDQLAKAIEEEVRRQSQTDRGRAIGLGLSVETEQKSLQERIRESSMISSLRPNNIRVQDLAQVPTRPAKPRKLLALLVGFVLGLLGGIGTAVIQEQLDSSLKNSDDLERLGGQALLGYIPHMDGMGGKRHGRRRYQVVRHAPFSAAAEAYRSLRTSLLYAAPAGGAHTIVVTSPGVEEGKTTTVTNLGIALAQSKLKVVLVDADLRKGCLHAVFGLERSPGLSEFLIGQATWEEIVKLTDVEGLSVVASGAFPPNPAELLSSAGMQDFLMKATQTFNRVLVDSPPTLAVADSAILGALTKAVVAVAKSRKTPRQALHRLVTVCSEVQAKLLGVVLNDISTQDTPSYYRYYRYAAYYHDSPQDGGNQRRSSSGKHASL